MKAFRRVFQDRTINNLMVAFIIATGTVNFLFFLGQMSLTPITQGGSVHWDWNQFLSQLVILLASILVAMVISTFARNNQK